MVADWNSTKKRYRDWEVIQAHCKHCMPENSLKGPHTCRMYEEKTKQEKIKGEIRIICQKCQKESKIEKEYEEHLIAKFTAQITLAEGNELMPEVATAISKAQNWNKAKEKLLECENWLKISWESALTSGYLSQDGDVDKKDVQDLFKLHSVLNFRCSYGLARCYLYSYFFERKPSLWLDGKKHLDYLESILKEGTWEEAMNNAESVRIMKEEYDRLSPKDLPK